MRSKRLLCLMTHYDQDTVSRYRDLHELTVFLIRAIDQKDSIPEFSRYYEPIFNTLIDENVTYTPVKPIAN